MLRTVNAILLPTALGALILYFSYHTLAGEQGLAAWAELQEQEEALKLQLARLSAERDALDHSLERLRDKTLDLDYVEELARNKLSYARADELLLNVR